MNPKLPTRRRFLGTCSTLAITAAMGPASALKAAVSRQRFASEISYADFAARVHKAFLVRNGDKVLGALTLAQTRELSAKPAANGKALDAGSEQFSLLFSGSRRRPLGQDTYTFEQAQLGRFDMFIVPVGRNDESLNYYEATFNRAPATRNVKTVPLRRTS